MNRVLVFAIVTGLLTCVAPAAESGQTGTKVPACTSKLSIRPMGEAGGLRIPKPEFSDVVGDQLVALWGMRDEAAFRRQQGQVRPMNNNPYTIGGALYDPKKKRWTRLGPPPMPLAPRGKNSFEFKMVAKRVVVVGAGWTGGAILDPAAGKWTQIAKAPFPVGQHTFAQAAVGECWFLWGDPELGKGFCLDVLKNQWRPVAKPRKARMTSRILGAVGRKLVFAEVELLPAAKTAKGRTAVYDTLKKRWTFQRQGEFPKSMLAYSEPGRQTVLFAGMGEDYGQGRGGPTALAATGSQLNLRSGKWRSIPKKDGPSASFVEGNIPFRPGAGTLWTGRHLVLRGFGKDAKAKSPSKLQEPLQNIQVPQRAQPNLRGSRGGGPSRNPRPGRIGTLTPNLEQPKDLEPRPMEDRALDTRPMRWVRVPPAPGKGLTLFRDGGELSVRSLPDASAVGAPVHRDRALKVWIFDLQAKRWCKARLAEPMPASISHNAGKLVFHLRYGSGLVLWGIGRTEHMPYKSCPPGAPCAMAPRDKEHFHPGGMVLTP